MPPLYLIVLVGLVVGAGFVAVCVTWWRGIPFAYPVSEMDMAQSISISGYPDDPQKRAELLFMNSLTPKQRKDWQQHHQIDVQGSNGTTYVLRYGRAWNVSPKRNVRTGYCAHVPNVPAYDDYLVQKLVLETDAPGFLKEACVSTLRNGRYGYV